ncbi:hypothetical protein, partial [Paenibacillus ihuae]|uniref:hypothetical protein n=1 Tax=Paenibacillus ihuae TaxID=1232431 RepID=UPI001ADF2E06
SPSYLGTVSVSAKNRRIIYSVKHINSYISKKASAADAAETYCHATKLFAKPLVPNIFSGRP